MKKIQLIIPLLILLAIILITAVVILFSPHENLQPAQEDVPNLQQETTDTPDMVDPEALQSAPDIDMSQHIQKEGLPTAHGSHQDYEKITFLPTTPTDSGSSIELNTRKISFLAVGDNLIHDYIFDYAARSAQDGGYYFDHIYENLADEIRSADLSFINQESPIAGDDFPISTYPMFNTPAEMGQTLLNLGFDIINIANNHMLDKYEKGLKNHIAFWEDKEVTLIGGYKNKEDYDNIRVVQKNGISIALLSYTYDTNGMTLPAQSEMIVPLIDSKTIVRQISLAKEKADLVFVSIHWGDENTHTPNARQRELAKLMADNGVDVVLGHHSHTVQPIEWYDRPDGRKTLVAFSLSNFISGMKQPKNTLAGMLTFDIEKTDGLPAEITNVIFNPTITHYDSSFDNFKLYYLKDYTQELHNQARCSQYESDYTYYHETIKDTISYEFLPDYLK